MGFLPLEFRGRPFRSSLNTSPIKPEPPVIPDPDPNHPKPEPHPPIPPPPSIEDPPAPGTTDKPVYTPPSGAKARTRSAPANARARHLVARYFL